MIAGLLGEHLASPRTASKTNQSTALEPKTATGGESSAGEEFASMVADETKPSPTRAESAKEVEATDVSAHPTHVASQTARIEAQFDESRASNRTGTPSLSEPSSLINPTESDAGLGRSNVPIDANELLPTASVEPTALTETSDPKLTVMESQGTVKVESDFGGDTPAVEPKLGTDRAQVAEIANPAAASNKLASASDLSTDVAQATALTDKETDTKNLKLTQTLDTTNTLDVSTNTSEIPRASLDVENVDLPVRSSTQLVSQPLTPDTASIVRDIASPVVSGEPVVTIGPAGTTPGAPIAATSSGLAPIAPSIPIASPNELTGIILNAIQNGLDPQEQLVVQLDPPELGRVMIDFKFDAQGLQQIIVTSENPEALKRLREMHSELTAALRDQGLSDQNLSFQEQTQDRPQNSWSGPDYAHHEPRHIASDDRVEIASRRDIDPRTSIRNRLDLTL